MLAPLSDTRSPCIIELRNVSLGLALVASILLPLLALALPALLVLLSGLEEALGDGSVGAEVLLERDRRLLAVSRPVSTLPRGFFI